MSNARNTNKSKISSNKIVIRYDLTLCVIDVQFDSNAIGIIIVVNNTK